MKIELASHIKFQLHAILANKIRFHVSRGQRSINTVKRNCVMRFFKFSLIVILYHHSQHVLYIVLTLSSAVFILLTLPHHMGQCILTEISEVLLTEIVLILKEIIFLI